MRARRAARGLSGSALTLAEPLYGCHMVQAHVSSSASAVQHFSECQGPGVNPCRPAVRGAALANRAFHATAVVTPPCGSQLAALVAAAVAPARDVGDGAVLVMFGGCSSGEILFGGHDLEVPHSAPTPPSLPVQLGTQVFARLSSCGLSGSQVHAAALHVQRCVPWPCGNVAFACMTLRVCLPARPLWSCVPAQVMQPNVPLHEDGQSCLQGRTTVMHGLPPNTARACRCCGWQLMAAKLSGSMLQRAAGRQVCVHTTAQTPSMVSGAVINFLYHVSAYTPSCSTGDRA